VSHECISFKGGGAIVPDISESAILAPDFSSKTGFDVFCAATGMAAPTTNGCSNRRIEGVSLRSIICFASVLWSAQSSTRSCWRLSHSRPMPSLNAVNPLSATSSPAYLSLTSAMYITHATSPGPLVSLNTRLRLFLTSLPEGFSNIAVTIICQFELNLKWVDDSRRK
jgi:hypothetical protein